MKCEYCDDDHACYYYNNVYPAYYCNDCLPTAKERFLAAQKAKQDLLDKAMTLPEFADKYQISIYKLRQAVKRAKWLTPVGRNDNHNNVYKREDLLTIVRGKR